MSTGNAKQTTLKFINKIKGTTANKFRNDEVDLETKIDDKVDLEKYDDEVNWKKINDEVDFGKIMMMMRIGLCEH